MTALPYRSRGGLANRRGLYLLLLGAIAPTLGWLLALIIAAGAQLLLTLAERPLWRWALRRNGYVERIHPPHDRRDGPTLTWSVEGRAWCEAAMLGER